MQAKAYGKSIKREILSSKARFLSILLIIFLGTAFFAGIKSAGPDMNNAANEYYQELKLMDSRIVSSLGLTDEDKELLDGNDKILSYYAAKSFDVSLTNINNVVKFMEYNKEAEINDFEVVEGRLPENSGEIAIDAQYLKKSGDLKIGDTFEVKADEESLKSLNTHDFTIVGFVNSPMYNEHGSRGTSSVGKGSVDFFAVVDADDIDMDVYTEIYVRFKNVQNIDTYSDEYSDLMEENTEYLKELFKAREDARVEEIKEDALDQLADKLKEIEDGEAKLQSAQSEIDLGKLQLENGKLQYENGLSQYESQKVSGEAKISQVETELNKGQAELDSKKKTLEDGQRQLDSAKSQLDSVKADLMKQGVNVDEGSAKYEEQLNQLEVLQSSGNSSEEVKKQIEELKTLINGISSYNSGKSQYEAKLKEIRDGEVQIQNAQNNINSGKAELAQSKKALSDAKTKLDESKKQIEESEEKLNTGQAEIDSNKVSLEDGRKTIEEKQEEINNIKGSYYYFDRSDLSGYSGYKDSINSIKNIASFLPLFFFLVAVLICLTTMTRMVEEKRIEIGTLKALGYNNFEIAKKYIIYASIASILGSLLGIIVGCYVFPYVIFTAYESMFNAGNLSVIFYPSYIMQSLVISILCTVGAALVVLKGELINKPCELMRAKAPKMGKKIFLERIAPLWKRFNFNQKVTLRNIFRYKQRMLMTVFGIAGCTAMLVLGFSLKASNTLIVDRQFGELWKYNAMVIFNDEIVDSKYEEILKEIDGFESSIKIHQESVSFIKSGINKQTASLYVPKDNADFENYIVLRDRKSKKTYSLDEDGAVINEKLAKLLDVKEGDYISFEDTDNNSYKVKVAHVTENYISHLVYMSEDTYKETFGKSPSFNAEFLKMDVDDNEETAEEIMDSSNVLNVTFVDSLIKSANDSSESMNLVMIVIIVSAGGLAFIVLYNLNNINVSERIRELSTIKVLGFYDNEVTMYILRENVILTILGILSGSLLGKYVYLYIIKTAELDNMMMVPEVHLMRYVTSGVLTLVFSVIVMIMMHLKLKKVNMIDALKSVE